MNETSTFFLLCRGAYRGIQLNGEGLKRLKLKLQEMDGAINHRKEDPLHGGMSATFRQPMCRTPTPRTPPPKKKLMEESMMTKEPKCS